jgi:3-oxoacyl-[acyl-carrier-protein] synthase-1
VEGGHCAGLMAVEQAWLRIARGEVDLCLVGGCDTYLPAETLEWLDLREQLKSRIHRWGFVPGEAAGFCLLASPEAAEQLQLTVRGRVLSAHTTREEQPAGASTVCLGLGLTRAIAQVLHALPADTLVDEVFCDQNGERSRADEYGFTLARLASHFRCPADFQTPADCWGDIGVASGPLLLCLAAMAGWRGYGPGPFSLLWTSSESGERSAVLLEVPLRAPRC